MEDQEIDLGSLLESKLQRLQLSEELEAALEIEFGKNQEDPLLSSKFDINEYINQHFGDGNLYLVVYFYSDLSLNQVEQKIC